MHFSLELRDNNKLIKIFQVVFGVICIAIAVYWLIYNFSSAIKNQTLWITVAFLLCFGGYLIWSGLGYAYRYIDISDEKIKVKQNAFLPVKVLQAGEIDKIDIYPLKVVFLLKSSKKILIRFGVTDYEKIERIKDEFLKFAERNDIKNDINNENLT